MMITEYSRTIITFLNFITSFKMMLPIGEVVFSNRSGIVLNPMLLLNRKFFNSSLISEYIPSKATMAYPGS